LKRLDAWEIKPRERITALQVKYHKPRKSPFILHHDEYLNAKPSMNHGVL
jgi:hypothetical protein